MKSISPTVYESLTPRQRIIATIEAEARDDQEEVQRLVKTCPKKTYRMNDADYAEEVQLLLADSMAMECDMSYMAINFLFVSLRGKSSPEIWLNSMAVLQAAWDAEIEERGIDPATMSKAGCQRHPIVNYLLDTAPPPSAEAVQELRQRLAQARENRSAL